MSNVTTCPGLKALSQLALSQLPEPARKALMTHLAQCSGCTDTLRQLRCTAPADMPTLITNPETASRAAPPLGNDIGQVGPYRLLQILGTGGMGVVYQAEDRQLRRLVALKVMKPEFGQAEKPRQRFLREARAMGILEHDNIVRIYQVGEEQGRPYLAMQLLQGETLCDRLGREGRLRAREVARIGREIASGLAAAHQQGVIHRDIKPANIWLEQNTGRVKILDFGLARSADDTPLTQTGTVVGTPEYMSPEQTQGKPIDQRTDLFSLGSVLYHLCAGRSPFFARETMAILMAVISQTPTSLTLCNRDLPEPLVVLIERLMAKNPDDRPSTAAEVAAQFQEIEQALDGVTPSALALPSSQSSTKAGSSSRALFLVALLLGAIAFAACWFGSPLLRLPRPNVDQTGHPAIKK